jgi:hypothetical protein
LHTFLDPAKYSAIESFRKPVGYAGHVFSVSAIIIALKKGLSDSHS